MSDFNFTLDAKLAKGSYTSNNNSSSASIEGWQPVAVDLKGYQTSTTFGAQLYEKDGQYKLVFRGTEGNLADTVPSICKTINAIAVCALMLVFSNVAQAQVPETQQRLSSPRNQSSQRYEINQTFDGQAFYKDNNVWVYTKEFADLFGMPAKYIDDVQGIAAAAFRIEDTSYQECGFGGRADACRKVEQCLIDLYFNERETPLPWASEIKTQWLPWYSSMGWLRPLDPKERPHGVLAIDPQSSLIRDRGRHGQIIAFADPISKQEATFTSNARIARGDEEAISEGMGIIGYFRNFYRDISVLNLQFGCSTIARKDVHIRLDSKVDGPYGTPIARFNKVYLPPSFVQRINESIKANSDKSAIFYRSLFAPPLGTKGSDGTSPRSLVPNQ